MECQLFVLENCCTDPEPDANEFAMTRLLPCIATVTATGYRQLVI